MAPRLCLLAWSVARRGMTYALGAEKMDLLPGIQAADVAVFAALVRPIACLLSVLTCAALPA
jgi:hypothetical protein